MSTPQHIDGMLVELRTVGGRLWHVWQRSDTGGQIHASMGDRAYVNGPEHSGFYAQDENGKWKREHGPWGGVG